jgi:nitroreductase|tara:strand:- start:130 stop:639 length:510 start_codon:yes stop_codon:yes gene_type:complete
MEVYKAVTTVLAVREFSENSVSDTIIDKIIESARLTGSSMNRQPWHFILVRNRNTLTKIGELVTSGPYNAQSAFAVVVAVEKSSPFGISDASRAIQSMMLTAWSEGVGSNWTGWVGMVKIADLLHVPANLDVIAVVPFGYPKHVRTKGIKNRKPLAKVAHLEQFGTPLC